MIHQPVLIDLSTIVATLTSFGGVSGVLSVMRIVFLDRLLSRLSSDQQNVMLRAVLYALNYGAIIGLSLLFGSPVSASLFVSAIAFAAVASGASHLIFAGAKIVAGGTDPSIYPPASPYLPLGLHLDANYNATSAAATDTAQSSSATS